MIIPVKCFTCGKVLGDKYLYYLREVRQIKINKNLDTNKVVYLTSINYEKTPEGVVMDKLRLNKICCRRHMLTHIDVE
ncbi:MAG: hypothetical protein CML42_07615 [Rhodobacteraceae bacterium]|nr:hypothetical protein [Paracoccaceae bacterium]|tara:strand:+ start:4397 stop:4630 length:234 start_codon:yes stop_codon:yes gene_type:complete